MAAIRAIDQGEAGRSFNISYGTWTFGNFQDYTYEHTYEPSAIESTRADISSDSRIYTLQGTLVSALRKGINIVDGRKVIKQ